MNVTMVSFRCPPEIEKCLNELHAATQKPRSDILSEAVQQMNKEVLRRDGRLIPPYTDQSVARQD